MLEPGGRKAGATSEPKPKNRKKKENGCVQLLVRTSGSLNLVTSVGAHLSLSRVRLECKDASSGPVVCGSLLCAPWQPSPRV